MTAPVPPYDEQMKERLAEIILHSKDEKIGEVVDELVSLATAAAYRHAAARVRAVAFDDTDRGGFVGLAAFFEAWAEKAEQA